MEPLLSHESFDSTHALCAARYLETGCQHTVYFSDRYLSERTGLNLLQQTDSQLCEPYMNRDRLKSPLLSEPQFLKWQALLEDRTGMYISLEHRSLLESNLTIRMREIDCTDVEAYYSIVSAKPDGIREWTILLDRIMVQETRFYRNPESLSLVAKFLQQRLNATGKERLKALNIWSVGCSSGEEPYTLAMLCQEAIASTNRMVSYGITATDISLPVLEKARNGIYNERRLLDLKSTWIDRYFDPVNDTSYRVKDLLKKKVCFSMANMIDIEKNPLRNMDLIYCQNVLIYFRKDRKYVILNNLVKRLAPGGLLVIGQGEATDWHHPDVTRVADNQTLAFIRRTQEH
jgi:chemotaxis protein methyltransferase CheR/type IV pilus assembly protein PilK